MVGQRNPQSRSPYLCRCMIKYLQLPLTIDVSKMQREVDALTGIDWSRHYNTRHYEGDWTVISLRSPNGVATNIISLHATADRQSGYADTPLLDQSPYLRSVIDQFKCEKTMIRLMRLNAGAVIKTHTDHDMNYEAGEARFHIPVFTNDDVDFYVDEEKMHLGEGECWYLNLNLPHRVTNAGNADRIHLVIDCMVNEWVSEQFTRSDIIKKEIDAPKKPAVSSEQKSMIVAELRRQNTATANALADKIESDNEA